MAAAVSGSEHGQGHGHAHGHVRSRDQGVEKAQGLEKAALAQARNDKRAGAGDVEPERPAPPAVVVELGRPDAMADTYSSRGIRADQAGSVTAFAIADTVILGEGASLKINAHIDTLVGGGDGGNLVLEDGASLKINVHVGTLVEGGGTIVVGEGASLHLNLHADTLVSGGHLEIADGANVKANVHVHTLVPAASEEAAEAQKSSTLPIDVDTVEKTKRKRNPSEDDEKADPFRDLKDARWLLLREIIESTERLKIDHGGNEQPGRGKAHGRHTP